MMGASSSRPDHAYAEMTKYYSTYFLPFYAGLFFSCIFTFAKKLQVMSFSFIMTLGAIVFLIEYMLDAEHSAGIGIINFAGGFFEGITPTYRKFLAAEDKTIVFEVAPKEAFAVAGTIGYLAVFCSPFNNQDPLQTLTANFMSALILYLSLWISPTKNIVIALIMGVLLTAAPMILLPMYGKTPIELFTERRMEECREEIGKMYETEYDAKKRYVDVQNVVQLTDKYSVSFFGLLKCPSSYRNALLVGIIIGLSQGIINVFFEQFFCHLADTDTTLSYCQNKFYNPESGFAYLFFLNILAIGPTLFFLYSLERILQCSYNLIGHGRVKLFIVGMAGTVIVLAIIQIFARVSTITTFFGWNAYIVQGLLMTYTIVIYSSTLGPTQQSPSLQQQTQQHDILARNTAATWSHHGNYLKEHRQTCRLLSFASWSLLTLMDDADCWIGNIWQIITRIVLCVLLGVCEGDQRTQ
eukprot:TRINITY_DN121634_c0_g1_i1.p1 TRINITY_DN121634_c0_g1~~TRINITY_DN121634_c0_g1_i1.p1  ORF type:complete len:468 (-),score=9.49 TRINITY_DN121634_c0_g1_i1:154-1557(-)